MAENLSRLRSRGLNAKRSLALREFALGIEGLERFVRQAAAVAAGIMAAIYPPFIVYCNIKMPERVFVFSCWQAVYC